MNGVADHIGGELSRRHARKVITSIRIATDESAIEMAGGVPLWPPSDIPTSNIIHPIAITAMQAITQTNLTVEARTDLMWVT